MTVTVPQVIVTNVLWESMGLIVMKSVLLVVMAHVIKTPADVTVVLQDGMGVNVINYVATIVKHAHNPQGACYVNRDTMRIHVVHHARKTVTKVVTSHQGPVMHVPVGSMDLSVNQLVEEDVVVENAVGVLARAPALLAGQVTNVTNVLIFVLHVIAQDVQAAVQDTMDKLANLHVQPSVRMVVLKMMANAMPVITINMVIDVSIAVELTAQSVIRIMAVLLVKLDDGA